MILPLKMVTSRGLPSFSETKSAGILGFLALSQLLLAFLARNYVGGLGV